MRGRRWNGTQKKDQSWSCSGINNEELIRQDVNPQNMLTASLGSGYGRRARAWLIFCKHDIRGMGPLSWYCRVRGHRSFQMLSANDIENVSVLKDASAAITESRGGNGVVLSLQGWNRRKIRRATTEATHQTPSTCRH
jgi:hypothetical protein